MEKQPYIKLLKIKKTPEEIKLEIKENIEEAKENNVEISQEIINNIKKDIKEHHYGLFYRINMNHSGGRPLPYDLSLRLRETSKTIVEKFRSNGKQIEIRKSNSYDRKERLGDLTKNEFNRIKNYLVKEHPNIAFFVSDKKKSK